MVMIILKTSIPLLKESSMILMQTVPTHLKIKEIQEKLVGQINGVLSIHEFHIWQLSGNKIIGKLRHHFKKICSQFLKGVWVTLCKHTSFKMTILKYF